MGNLGFRAGVAWYYAMFGWRGIVAGIGVRTIGMPKTVSFRPTGTKHPFCLRVKTSDERVYNETLCRGAYAVDLSFTPNVILDAGANIGAATVFFANRYPKAMILAIEPEESNYALLARNVALYPNVFPFRAALWNCNGEISVSEAGSDYGTSGNWAFVTHDVPGGNRVRAVTLDALMHETGVKSIDLAKIDIEGAEQELFQNTEWLSGVRCLMIETHDRFRPGCSLAVDSAMKGFSRSQRGEATIYIA